MDLVQLILAALGGDATTVEVDADGNPLVLVVVVRIPVDVRSAADYLRRHAGPDLDILKSAADAAELQTDAG